MANGMPGQRAHRWRDRRQSCRPPPRCTQHTTPPVTSPPPHASQPGSTASQRCIRAGYRGGGAHRRAGGRACAPSVLPATTRSKRETSGSCLTQPRCVHARPGGADAGGGVGGDCAPGNSNYRLFYDSAPSAACEVVVSGSGHFQFLDRQSLLQQAVCAQVRFRHPHLPQLQFARLCPRGHRGHRQLTRGSCRSCPAAAVVCPGDPLKPCGSSGLYAHRDCQWCKQWLLGTACRFGYWYH